MFSFHPASDKRAELGAAGIQERLPLGSSVIVIAGLSALSWAILIASVMALRAAL
jgi:hypothetical protein